MKTRGILICSFLAVVAATLWAQSALAVPVFARKYGFNCTMCHSNVPRLNDFGQRYRRTQRADGQADKKHARNAEPEAEQADFAHQVAQADHDEQSENGIRRQRGGDRLLHDRPLLQ